MTISREERLAQKKEYRQNNKEKIAAYQREYRERNRAYVRALNKASYERNKDGRLARARAKYCDNPEPIRARNRRWQKEDRKRNRAKYNAFSARQHTARLKRCPAWADLDAVRFFYECCPEGCHVDHVIPLQGGRVSGLHVAENLQWLPKHVNWSKNNRWLPDG